MSVQSDAAKNYIEKLLSAVYGYAEPQLVSVQDRNKKQRSLYSEIVFPMWTSEYPFCEERKWRFDYAVPAFLCAMELMNYWLRSYREQSSFLCAIELDGGTGGQVKKVGNDYYVRLSGHNSPKGLRDWREKNNEAMRRGWKVFHYAPEEVIKAGRKNRSPVSNTLRVYSEVHCIRTPVWSAA